MENVCFGSLDSQFQLLPRGCFEGEYFQGAGSGLLPRVKGLLPGLASKGLLARAGWLEDGCMDTCSAAGEARNANGSCNASSSYSSFDARQHMDNCDFRNSTVGDA